jgi:ABC-2 type transport system permease protein
MSRRRTLAVARKEFLHILRDPRSLAMALAIPVLLLLLFGVALTLDVDRIPTLIYDADGSPQSRELIARFDGSRFFEVTGYTRRYGEIEPRIDAGRALFAVVIPPDFSSDLLGGRRPRLQLLVDGSDSNTASIALNYAAALLAQYEQDVRAEAQNRRVGRVLRPPVEARLRVWYNSELKSKNYVVPGLIAVILMIIAALLASLTIAREWETGTMEQLLATPLRPAEIIIGKMLAYFSVGIADTVTAILVGVFVFGVPFRGSAVAAGAACILFLTGALFWGILISAVARSQLLAYQIGMITSFLPAFLLSGFVFAIETMPRPIQLVTYLVPARYFITILKGVFLKGVGLGILAGDFALLAAYAALVFLVASRKLRQKVA